MLRTILLLAGLPGVWVGLSLLLTPVSFQAGNGIDLAGDVNLLSETRSAGGALAVIGAMIMSGVVVAELAWFSTLLTIAVYLAYGLSRMLSISVDGIPHDALLYAAAAELAIGLMGVFAWMKYRAKPTARGMHDPPTV